MPVNRALVVVTRVGWAWAGVVPSEEWVAAREDLLRRVTAAALLRVGVPLDWVWLVAPERREQVLEMACRLRPIPTIVASDKDAEAVAPWHDQFLVARIDSDDAYLPEALENAADMELPPDTLVNWPCGWQLDWATGRMQERSWSRRTQGPFLAITSEGRENIPEMLITGGPHGGARAGRCVARLTEPSWVLTIHGGSTNSWHNIPPIPECERDLVLAQMGIILEAKE